MYFSSKLEKIKNKTEKRNLLFFVFFRNQRKKNEKTKQKQNKTKQNKTKQNKKEQKKKNKMD